MRNHNLVNHHNKRGRPFSGKTPAKNDLVRLYVKRGKSIREVAEALCCSKDMVSRALKACESQARTKAKRSKLRKYPLVVLKAGVKRKGKRGLARNIGVDESTLRHHLIVRKAEK